MKKFSSGAVRSTDADGYRLDLVPAEGLIRAGVAAAHGAEKYGEHNWQKGMPLSEFINHLLVHIYKYLAGDRTEDHLGHAAWNAMAACTAEERGWTTESLANANPFDTVVSKKDQLSLADEFQKALLEEYQKAKFKKGRPQKDTPYAAPPVLGPSYKFEVVEQKKVGGMWELMLCVDLDDERKAFISIRSLSLPSQSELESEVRQYMNSRDTNPGDDYSAN